LPIANPALNDFWVIKSGGDAGYRTEKWRRRREARPAEIIDAALEIFTGKGFAAKEGPG